MCYSGMCKYERAYTGECKGSVEWNRHDSLCSITKEVDYKAEFEACFRDSDEAFEHLADEDRET